MEERERKRAGRRAGWVRERLRSGQCCPYPLLTGPSLPEARLGGGEAEGGGSQHHHRVAPETTAGHGQEVLVGRFRASLRGLPGYSRCSSLRPK